MINLEKTKEQTMNVEQTCPVCFRAVKTKNNFIWAHGYRNNGIRMGTCFGANKLSFESSKKGSQEYLVFLRKTEKNLKEVLSENELNKTLKNNDVRKIRNEIFEIYMSKKDILKKLKQRNK